VQDADRLARFEREAKTLPHTPSSTHRADLHGNTQRAALATHIIQAAFHPYEWRSPTDHGSDDWGDVRWTVGSPC
jgi:hypothetical protein